MYTHYCSLSPGACLTDSTDTILSLQNVMLTHPSLVGQLKNCIQLAACGSKEMLPMNPKLPADLFTTCLTTPIKTALLWYCLQRVGKLSLVARISTDIIDKCVKLPPSQLNLLITCVCSLFRVPGRLNDRRTPLGELNWIFTAITDTIAWNTIPRGELSVPSDIHHDPLSFANFRFVSEIVPTGSSGG